MLPYLVQAVTVTMVLGVASACDMQPAMACIQPIMQAAQSMGPGADGGDVSEALRTMCQAIDTLPQCLASAGCDENSDQLAQVMAGISQGKQQCASLKGEGPEGSCDRISVMGECYGNMQNMDPNDRESTCSAINAFVECAANYDCDEDELYTGAGADTFAAIKEAKKQCSGAATATISSLLMLAAAFFLRL